MNTVKKRFISGGSAQSPTRKQMLPDKERLNSPLQSKTYDGISPELVPIVTLLSSQAHRRYHEGIFMLYYDLNGDGKPADREWKEVYGILTGNQLAYWDAANLAEFRNDPSMLFELSSKPNYINFTDSVYNAVRSLPAAKQNLDNVIIVSTTLKNRYIIQFKTYNDMTAWYLALRLSNYEYSALQEAYTGALLSAKGSRLSDIRTILAEKRFDHEDWVGIRYGSGMAWKRCYAVIEPSVSKKNSFTPGRILFYENEQKKKKQLMAVVIDAHSVAATYPQSHLLIDQSTMTKIDAQINFKSPSISSKASKKASADFRRATIFLMPEQHSSVPGFDTLIRFLIPLLDSFGLYGRPKRLKADRVDPDSLLFGLPILPNVHYLDTADVSHLSSNGAFLDWSAEEWKAGIKAVMKSKLDKGYEGCGSKRGLAGAITSLNSPKTTSTSSFKQSPQLNKNQRTFSNLSEESKSRITNKTPLNVNNLKIDVDAKSNLGLPPSTANHNSIELAEIYHKYSEIKSPSDQFHMDRSKLLNGSDEVLNEDDLPADIRKITLEESNGIYPKDDADFLDNDDDFDEDSGNEERDANLNSGANMGLTVPSSNYRNSSYSSVQSPMTQYNEFNKQFSATVDPKIPDSVAFVNSNNSDSDEDFDADTFIKPSSPIRSKGPNPIAKSNPSYSLSESINQVPQGINRPDNESDSRDYLSIHSESGKVISADSSPNSQLSSEPIPRLQAQGNYKPKYISSPNNSQNQNPKFSSEIQNSTIAPSHGYKVSQPYQYHQSRSGNYPDERGYMNSASKSSEYIDSKQEPSNSRQTHEPSNPISSSQHVKSAPQQNQNLVHARAQPSQQQMSSRNRQQPLQQQFSQQQPPQPHQQQQQNTNQYRGYNLPPQGSQGQFTQTAQYKPRMPSSESHQAVHNHSGIPPSVSYQSMPKQYNIGIPPSVSYEAVSKQNQAGIPPTVSYQSIPKQNQTGIPPSSYQPVQRQNQMGIPPSVSNPPVQRQNQPGVPPQGYPNQGPNRPSQQGYSIPRYQTNHYGQAPSSLRSYDSANQQQYSQVPSNIQHMQPQYNPNQYPQQSSQHSRQYNQNGSSDYPVER